MKAGFGRIIRPAGAARPRGGGLDQALAGLRGAHVWDRSGGRGEGWGLPRPGPGGCMARGGKHGAPAAFAFLQDVKEALTCPPKI